MEQEGKPTLMDLNTNSVKLVTIPKLIMQTWKTTEIPEKWSSSPESIEQHMPDWSLVLMTDEDNRKFVEIHFPDFLDTYDGFPYAIQRADAIRYMWLYVHGGIYMDLDYHLEGPLDSLFYEGSGLYFMKSPNVTSYYTNSFMASQPRHPFWLDMIDSMREYRKNIPLWAATRHFQVMYSTGPGMLTTVINKSKYPHTVIPYMSVVPYNFCNGNFGNGLMKPLEGSSWAEWDTAATCWIYCNPWTTVLAVILFIILIIIVIIIICKAVRRSRV